MRIRWRGLELPTRVVRDEEVSTETYARFTVEPFERGFGTTIGNSLRRILLSSLEGAAVTLVRIKGADHEFMTLPGVMEDVTAIILNIKSLIVKSTSDTPKGMKINVTGKAGAMTEVRASDIEADAAIEIINQDQLIATLTDACSFEVEMTVGRGRSYATAEENKPEGDQIIGMIPIDSVFSPVTRVRYRVEDTRVGQRTNYDRLIMELWTNGTVTPQMALVEAAKILRKHVNSFVQYFEMGSMLAAGGHDAEPHGETAGHSGTEEGILSRPVSSLDLSVRASNCLASAEIQTVGQLVQWDEANLLKLRSFGKTSLREVKRKLADLGMSLASSGDEDADGMDYASSDGYDEDDDDGEEPFGGSPPAAGEWGDSPAGEKKSPEQPSYRASAEMGSPAPMPSSPPPPQSPSNGTTPSDSLPSPASDEVGVSREDSA